MPAYSANGNEINDCLQVSRETIIPAFEFHVKPENILKLRKTH